MILRLINRWKSCSSQRAMSLFDLVIIHQMTNISSPTMSNFILKYSSIEKLVHETYSKESKVDLT